MIIIREQTEGEYTSLEHEVCNFIMFSLNDMMFFSQGFNFNMEQYVDVNIFTFSPLFKNYFSVSKLIT